MMSPSGKEKRRERIASVGLALFLIAGLWVLAALIQISGARQQQRILRELALERIVLPEVIARAAVPRNSAQAPAPKATVARASLEALRQSAVLDSEDIPDPVDLASRPTTSRREIELLPGQVPVERLQRSDRLDLGSSGGRRLPGRSSLPGGRENGRISLAGTIPEGEALDEQGRPSLSSDLATRPPPVRREVPQIPPSIQPQERRLDLTGDDLDVDELIAWMRLRPGALPPGIQRHVDWREENITAMETIEHSGQRYELYLMARLEIREIHVVLVLGEQTYYLIDRSFLHDGRNFRAGAARRSDGVITGVISEERAAASPEATRFYEVFLSWWKRERLRL